MRLHSPRSRVFLVNIQLLEALADQTFAVGSIIDDEILCIGAEVFDLHAKKAGTEGVKCTQPYIMRRFTYQRVDTVTHFACGFIRKCNRKNAIRWNIMFQEVCNAEGQHACLAGACARHNEERSLKTGYGSLLRLVQPLKQIHENSFQ